MLVWSYPIDKEITFLETFASKTVEICNGIKNNIIERRLFDMDITTDDYRQSGLTLTNALPDNDVDLCYEENTICSLSSHCCNGLECSLDHFCEPINPSARRNLRGDIIASD